MDDSQCIAIERHQRFGFACGPSLACFTACCRDLNQALGPYDVLRLRRHLGLSGAEFLARYASLHMGPGSGLPVASLRPASGAQRLCPFVSPAGCGVYSDRPASCRLYPLVRLLHRRDAAAALQEQFLLLREPHCQGFSEQRWHNSEQWLASQELAPYNAFNDRLFSLICHKHRRPGPLSEQQRQACTAAFYELDSLRAQLRQGRAPADLHLDEPLRQAAAADDETLLAAAMDWVQRVVLA